MRDGTFFEFIKDYNAFKSSMDEHLVMTDFRDFETYMFMRAFYNLMIKIPLFKIFFSHQLGKIAKKRNDARKAREGQVKEIKEKIKVKKESNAFAEKIKI